ncbi:MAG: FIST C-terminal domain-containing protein [Defluviitaleaceae bacterium]|nr:FIST C-terminal domain-containing protein [Defluviitaleaceae bacterium]MCL2275274.1 FIST C-terminal domain-containing protein [Defluviitaleaceae bacterium]
MVEMRTARISEVDDFESAIADIKAQINLSTLKKHTGAILFYGWDFYESGMAQAICNALPFDVMGMTAMGSASPQGYGYFDLTLAVMTSDEVSFTGGIVTDIDKNNYEAKISDLYKRLCDKTTGAPAMIFSFMPLSRGMEGNLLLNAVNKISEGIPIWGSLPSSMGFDYSTVGVVYNGTHCQKGMAMMFVNGPVTPRFITAALPERNISRTRGIITKSEGSVVWEVNDMPVLEYFSYLKMEIGANNMHATPIMVHLPSVPEPMPRAMYLVQEDGSILLGGNAPEGAAISVGNIDTNTIVESCTQGLAEVIKEKRAAIVMPCASRSILMAPDQEGEMRLIREKLNESGIPFLMGYSNGEISPVLDTEGKLRNHFHNFTFCACVL